jgi:hypothetical protein
MPKSSKSTTTTTNHNTGQTTTTTTVTTRPTTFSESFKAGSSVVGIILALLLFVALFRELRGLPTITFSGFLEFLQGVPDVSTSWATTIDLTIYGNWEVFEFLRIFLNMFTDVFELLILVSGGLVQTFTFVLYFLHYLFGF